MMMQMTGDPRRIDAFINLMSDYTILEISARASCRSNAAAPQSAR